MNFFKHRLSGKDLIDVDGKLGTIGDKARDKDFHSKYDTYIHEVFNELINKISQDKKVSVEDILNSVNYYGESIFKDFFQTYNNAVNEKSANEQQISESEYNALYGKLTTALGNTELIAALEGLANALNSATLVVEGQ